jgi:hypothetical protein
MRRCVVLLGLLLAGCYGQTDPATDVTQSGATLRGHGTTDHGPADVWFEYWPTAAIAQRKLTPERRIPGDVTAPFAERVSGLTANTHYSFRLCGRDVGGPTACTPVRSFTTGQDFVRGNGYGQVQIGIYELFDVDAFNGPQGSGPSGRVFAQWGDPYPGVVVSYGSRTTPNTTCVAVRGHEAGLVGFPRAGTAPPPGLGSRPGRLRGGPVLVRAVQRSRGNGLLAAAELARQRIPGGIGGRRRERRDALSGAAWR